MDLTVTDGDVRMSNTFERVNGEPACVACGRGYWANHTLDECITGLAERVRQLEERLGIAQKREG